MSSKLQSCQPIISLRTYDWLKLIAAPTTGKCSKPRHVLQALSDLSDPSSGLAKQTSRAIYAPDGSQRRTDTTMLFTITAGTLGRAAKSFGTPPFMTEVVAVIRKSISALAYSALSMNYLCRCLDVFLIIRQIEHRTGLLSLISVCYVSVSCAPVRIFTQTVIAHFQEMIRVKGGRITAGM